MTTSQRPNKQKYTWLLSAKRRASRLHLACEKDANPTSEPWASRFASTLCGQSSIFTEVTQPDPAHFRCDRCIAKSAAREKRRARSPQDRFLRGSEG